MYKRQGDNKDPLSSLESVQKAPALPLLGFAVVIGIMIMLYRAQPPLRDEEISLDEKLELRYDGDILDGSNKEVED